MPLVLWQLSVGRALCLLLLLSWYALAADRSNYQQNPVSEGFIRAMNEGARLSSQGHLAEAGNEFSRAAVLAHNVDNAKDGAKALVALSGCRIGLFDYRAAQRAASEGFQLAKQAKVDVLAGSAKVNLATIYMQVGDFRRADREAAEATEDLKNAPGEYYAKALLLYANVEAEVIREKALNKQQTIDQITYVYQRAVDVAHGAGLHQIEAQSWEEMGEAFLRVYAPQSAENPLERAYRLESKAHDEDALAVNKQYRADLQLQEQNYRAGLQLIDEALRAHSAYFRTNPIFIALHTRGILLQNLNRNAEALVDLRRAVQAATDWRQGILPGDASSTRTTVLLHDVYNDYAQLAAALSLKNHDPGLARSGLEALAANRAASLREQIALAYGQKLSLPPRYFDLLSDLQATQARVTLGEASRQDRTQLDEIRLEIGGIENQLGQLPQNISRSNERNAHRNSLRSIQSRLYNSELLLSFSLGQEKSFLWAVTENQVNLYKLPGSAEIGNAAQAFTLSVQTRSDSTATAQRLTQLLFGQLPRVLWRRPDWVIVGDGVLLDSLPFASLRDLGSGSGTAMLDEAHNLRQVPSELLLLTPARANPHSRFVGVGDPIYNVADSRVAREKRRSPMTASRASLALSRLPGGDREVRTAAKESGMAQSQILVGPEATLGDLQKAIAQDPEIVHFAVHVVSAQSIRPGSPGESSQAALALSLTKHDIPELLTPEAIATLRVPGSLVILSGCSSQKGEILPGAGLMGLSRAWLLAGATAVVVSAWPTPDDSGQFFSSFYGHFDTLASGSLAQRAAIALQRAQIDMQHGSGYRSSPKFWAAYSIISKE